MLEIDESKADLKHGTTAYKFLRHSLKVLNSQGLNDCQTGFVVPGSVV